MARRDWSCWRGARRRPKRCGSSCGAIRSPRNARSAWSTRTGMRRAGRGMQSAALLVVRAKGGYLGGTDRYIDIRVYDAPDPIKELQRLYALHKLYFFTSDSADLIPITPALQKELEAILLTEPANQPQK